MMHELDKLKTLTPSEASPDELWCANSPYVQRDEVADLLEQRDAALRELIAKWRKRVPSSVDALEAVYNACADELEALLKEGK